MPQSVLEKGSTVGATEHAKKRRRVNASAPSSGSDAPAGSRDRSRQDRPLLRATAKWTPDGDEKYKEQLQYAAQEFSLCARTAMKMTEVMSRCGAGPIRDLLDDPRAAQINEVATAALALDMVTQMANEAGLRITAAPASSMSGASMSGAAGLPALDAAPAAAASLDSAATPDATRDAAPDAAPGAAPAAAADASDVSNLTLETVMHTGLATELPAQSRDQDQDTRRKLLAVPKRPLANARDVGKRKWNEMTPDEQQILENMKQAKAQKPLMI